MAGESMCRWEKAVKWEKGGEIGGGIGKGRALKYDNPDKSYIWVIGFIRVIGFLCVIPYGYWCLLLACQSMVCFEKVSVILAFSRSSCTIAGAPI